MSVEEASELWGLSPAWVKRLCASGAIRARQMGKQWVIDREQSRPTRRKAGDEDGHEA
ncbi:helix-turn-helix domain-containing protein [Alicyclobacillus macrosporangiidus]|uniref:helix-turn-helix domain-containing protein n=1 Tax=Alicyclobacillus macrosporangiidus TaxID=392015 RepID=UPI0009F8136F